MKLKEIELNKNNKAFTINTKLTFISALFIIAFYFFPAFASLEGMPYWFLVRFFLYFLMYTGFEYPFLEIFYVFFIAGFIGSILLFSYSIKFNMEIKIKNKIKKYLIYLILQLIFSFGLLYFGIDIFIKGTAMKFDMPRNEIPRNYYPEPMIFAIIITLITLFQLIHYIYILRNRCTERNGG